MSFILLNLPKEFCYSFYFKFSRPAHAYMSFIIILTNLIKRFLTTGSQNECKYSRYMILNRFTFYSQNVKRVIKIVFLLSKKIFIIKKSVLNISFIIPQEILDKWNHNNFCRILSRKLWTQGGHMPQIWSTTMLSVIYPPT